MPGWSDLGKPPGWDKLRRYILRRDGYRCQVVGHDGRPCGRPATDCGHIVARALGGTNHPDNLRAECPPHNRADGARLGNALRSGRPRDPRKLTTITTKHERNSHEPQWRDFGS